MASAYAMDAPQLSRSSGSASAPQGWLDNAGGMVGSALGSLEDAVPA
jgi:hypothetical protein